MARPLGLRIQGKARQNNLKNISLEIPHDRLTVVTGVFRLRQVLLAFDTLFAEGQWRYIRVAVRPTRGCSSPGRPADVDRIEADPSAVALEQKESGPDGASPSHRHRDYVLPAPALRESRPVHVRAAAPPPSRTRPVIVTAAARGARGRAR